MASVVKYRYPEEDFQYVEGDDYSIDYEFHNVTQWQATGEAISQLSGEEGQKIGWFTKKTFSVKEGSITQKILTTAYGIPIGRHWAVDANTCYFSRYLVGQWWLESLGSAQPRLLSDFYPPILYEYKHPVHEPENKTYYYSNPVLTYWHPANGNMVFTFRVFHNGSETFSRTQINRYPYPVYILEEKQCSSNLCPVLCDDTICCYDNQGIAQESFLKVESIY